MISSKKAVEMQKIVVFILAFSVVIIVFIAILGPQGRVHDADESFQAVQDRFFEFTRDRSPINRERINANPDLIDSWQRIYYELLSLQLKSTTEYCIIPFFITELSDSDKIQFLHTGDDLLVRLGHSSNLFERLTIEGMSLFYGTFEDIDGSHFGRIRKNKAETIEFSSQSKARKVEESHGFSRTIFDAIVNGNVLESKTYLTFYSRRDNYLPVLHDPFSFTAISQSGSVNNPNPIDFTKPFFIIANSNEVIILLRDLDNTGDANNPEIYNILNRFNENSVFGSNSDGIPFCSPEHRDLLKPLNNNLELCTCDVANNQEMCRSLTESNCGVNCVWNDDTNVCFSDVSDIIPFYNSILDVFENMITDSRENTCWNYYDLDMSYFPQSNVGDVLNGLELKRHEGTSDINDQISFEIRYYLESPSGIRSRDIISDKLLPKFKFGNTDGIIFSYYGINTSMNYRNIIINGRTENSVQLENEIYRFYAKVSPTEIVLHTKKDFERKFNDINYDMVFCNPEVPYQLNLIENCQDAKGLSVCFYHGLTRVPLNRDSIWQNSNCYWDRGCKNYRHQSVGASNEPREIQALPFFDDVFETVLEKIENEECLTERDLEIDMGGYSFGIHEGYVNTLYLDFSQSSRFLGFVSASKNYIYPIIQNENIEICD